MKPHIPGRQILQFTVIAQSPAGTSASLRGALLLALFLILGGTPTIAQIWHQVGTDGWSVSSSDGQRFVMVGESGTIMRSLDGARTWEHAHSGTRVRLTAIEHTDPSTALVVGDSGIVLRTTDEGRSWQRVSTGTTANLRGLVIESAVAIAVGARGTLLRSTDGGATWEGRASGTTEILWAVTTLGEQRFVAVGASGTLLSSEDAGLTWSPRTSTVSAFLRAVRFHGAANGWAAGDDGTLIRTTDGGVSWSAVGGHGLTTVFTLELNGTTTLLAGGLGGANGPLARSDDGGSTWTYPAASLASTGTEIVRDIELESAMRGALVGNPGLIAASQDAGATWSIISHAPRVTRSSGLSPLDLLSAAFTAGGVGAIGGAPLGGGAPVLRTTDRGSTWRFAELDRVGQLVGMHFFSEDSALALLDNGTFFRSGDGGATWIQEPGVQRTPRASSYQSMTFASPTVGYMTADNLVYRTTDGGRTWSGTPLSGALFVSQVQFLSPSLGYAAAFGHVFRTTDGGESWQRIFERSTTRGSALHFVDSLNGVTTGAVGRYHRTTDGGITWDTVDTGDRIILNDIAFVDDQNGYMVGNPGFYLLRTSDAGRTWRRELPWPASPGDSAVNLYHIDAMPDGGTVIAYGSGAIVRGMISDPSGIGLPIERPVTGRASLVARPNVLDAGTRTVRVDLPLGVSVVASACLSDARGASVAGAVERIEVNHIGRFVEVTLSPNCLTSGRYYLSIGVREPRWCVPITVVAR